MEDLFGCMSEKLRTQVPFFINFGLDLYVVRRELAFLSHTVARVEMIDSSQILILQS